MKVYLTGPRAGKTENINGTQFIDGVAEVDNLSVYLQRYYGVTDKPPVVKDKEVLTPQDGVEVTTGLIMPNLSDVKESLKQAAKECAEKLTEDGAEDLEIEELTPEKELADIVKQKKEALSNKPPKPILDRMNELGSWWEMKAFVRDEIGYLPANKKDAIRAIKEFEETGKVSKIK